MYVYDQYDQQIIDERVALPHHHVHPGVAGLRFYFRPAHLLRIFGGWCVLGAGGKAEQE